jgi:hypothetical protein
MELKIKPFLIEQVESDYLVQKGFKQGNSDLSVALIVTPVKMCVGGEAITCDKKISQIG